MTTIKITELANIGTSLASSSLVPVVNMAGVPVTQKTNVGSIANLILEGGAAGHMSHPFDNRSLHLVTLKSL